MALRRLQATIPKRPLMVAKAEIHSAEPGELQLPLRYLKPAYLKLFYEPQAQLRSHPVKSPLVILGSADHPKFRSCLTLIRATASEECDRPLLAEALDQFYDGKPDARTLQILGME